MQYHYIVLKIIFLLNNVRTKNSTQWFESQMKCNSILYILKFNKQIITVLYVYSNFNIFLSLSLTNLFHTSRSTEDSYSYPGPTKWIYTSVESPARWKIVAWFSAEKIGNTGLRCLLSMKIHRNQFDNL